MDAKLTITGEDIIGWDGEDHTGALKELGVIFDPADCDAVWTREFTVNLDFMLRHGHLMNDESYQLYKSHPDYQRYHNEGRDAYLNGLDEDNPHDTGTVDDPGYWNTSLYHRRYPWYDGYRATQAADMEERYKIAAMRVEIRAIIERHGLTIKDCNEYPVSYSYAETPEGYFVKLT